MTSPMNIRRHTNGADIMSRNRFFKQTPDYGRLADALLAFGLVMATAWVIVMASIWATPIDSQAFGGLR